MTEIKSEEISIKEILIKIKEFRILIFSKWKQVVLFGLLGGILGFTYAWFQKPKYTADLTFALEEKSAGSGGLGAYAGIASQFGIDIGGGGGGAFTGDNMLELMKSRLLIEKTLLTEVEIGGKKQLLINRYLEFNKIREGWNKGDNEELKKLIYDRSDRIGFSRLKDSVLFSISKDIKDNVLQVSKLDKKLNIVSVKAIAEDELFVFCFTSELVKNVTDFYIETKTKKSRGNVEILERRTDSVKRELDSEMYGAAITQDQNINTIRARAKVPGVKRQMNVQMLSTMYAELVKNLEFSKLALMREEPLIQVIDRPILPLYKQKVSKLKSLILGGILAGFIYLFYLIFQLLLKKINQESN